MGAKLSEARINETVRTAAMDQLKPASASAILDSMVATEAELQALWAEMDQNVGIGCRMPVKRHG